MNYNKIGIECLEGMKELLEICENSYYVQSANEVLINLGDDECEGSFLKE